MKEKVKLRSVPFSQGFCYGEVKWHLVMKDARRKDGHTYVPIRDDETKTTIWVDWDTEVTV